ncbi:hypothetical protein GCM10025881_38220 [Pseudolysinimonas kribbensis]|uniref:FAD-binding PCMH-type domain-containing protein n=1 Tax=Pseudolysinimonas kribbensis TaxID=433641 RepID=A0ABQ6K9S9_9MICO|nr:FAD-dependent oxidoreductase [Pseudolysinimonas kribbensis]GMA96998.1 hypothetical protein GCM10025881_38220 [Pseudolysinimonas kribbensis]
METLRQDDVGYDEAATSYHVHGTPVEVLRPADAGEVAEAVRSAVERGLEVGVRGGGHTPWSTNDGGVVIDLLRLDRIEVGDDRLVTVGGGAVWGSVADALAPHGLAISSGDTASVGVGGLTVGGGIGWLVRATGLAVDQLVGAEVVTVAGEIVRASANEHPDLFWGIRGGGGNFGIVTEFVFRARPLRGVVHGHLEFDPAELRSVLRALRDDLRRAPDEWTANLLTLPSFGPEMPPPCTSRSSGRERTSTPPVTRRGRSWGIPRSGRANSHRAPTATCWPDRRPRCRGRRRRWSTRATSSAVWTTTRSSGSRRRTRASRPRS